MGGVVGRARVSNTSRVTFRTSLASRSRRSALLLLPYNAGNKSEVGCIELVFALSSGGIVNGLWKTNLRPWPFSNITVLLASLSLWLRY